MSRRSDKQLLIENYEIYNYYRERLINIALSQFEWENLPGTVDRLYFEKMLLYNGKAAMYKPEGLDDWMGTDFIQDGGFDAYGYPLGIRGITYNGQNLTTTEWMILYDNMTKLPLLPKIELYAKLLWEAHMTMRSNLQQQITPYIITTTRNEALSFKNLFNRIMGFQPVIEVKNSFDPNAIKTLDLRVPFEGEAHLNVIKSIWAEALSMLGIAPRSDKRERMIVDEERFNRQEHILSLNSRLMNRTEFCRKMNEKYGLTMSVTVSTISTEIIMEGEEPWLNTQSDYGTYSREQEPT